MLKFQLFLSILTANFLIITLLTNYSTALATSKNNDALPKGQGVAQAKTKNNYSFSKRWRLTSAPVPMVT